MKTLNEYILDNINNTVMISLSIDDKEPFQYNYWNWFNHNHPNWQEQNQLHLLKDDYSIGHILYNGSISLRSDGSIEYTHNFYPQKCILNFYFGGAK